MSLSFLRNNSLLLSLALAKLLVHLVTNLTGGYGYFRDEFYYIACSEHLDWGYVDHPPLSILLLAVNRLVLGDSLVALRFLPALAGAVTVVFTGLITRRLGGGAFAVALSAVTVIVSPVYLAINNVYSMNSFDLLFWTISIYLLTLILSRGNQRLWLAFGLIVGLAFQNKISILFLGCGLVVAFLLTPSRRYFTEQWIWLGGLVAAIVMLPNILWQVAHDWPTLEFMQNAQEFKIAATSPVEFLTGQVLQMHPLNAAIWVVGLLQLLLSSRLRAYRPLAVMFLAMLVLLTAQNAKPYYLSPAYPVLLGAGAVALESFALAHSRRWLKGVSFAMLIIGGAVTAPLVLPVFPVETFIRYSEALGVKPPAEERNETGKLPQHFADMFGWEELVQSMATVYDGLSPEDRRKCGIYVQNYGEAGAIDFLGKRFGLPNAVSGHNSYYLWGPGRYTGEIMIILGGEIEDHLAAFGSVEQVAETNCDYCMPYENHLPIYIARRLKRPIGEIWPAVRHYI